ncbi:hypothetical protein ACFRMQ_16110 [Kitasatospora sp. NPDC056783]|uniref:hypothetical protein n=1 Tax=Kitasatospora sp. NPDC056783 TaxID=3345943 RepID=UPI0036A36305
MDLLDQLRDPLAVVDDAATTLREMRLEDTIAAYPDVALPVHRTSDVSGLSAAFVARYAERAGQELRDRRASSWGPSSTLPGRRGFEDGP